MGIIIAIMSEEILSFGIAALLISLALAQIIWFLVSSKRNGRTFTVTREGLNEQSGKIRAIFERMNLSEKEMTSSLLLLEEIVMRMEENTRQAVTARVRNFYGKKSLLLVSRGEKFNPLEENTDTANESEEHIRDMIFKANSIRLTYKRRGKWNVVVVRAKKK